MRIKSNAEPWVGTWRPHKPRGPIAALYGSPGPKYALPGLTGISNHDPTKHKAPMFSFGTRHNLANSECSPGPRYFIPSNITRQGRDGTPAFSLHSRPRAPRVFQAPGPGKYSPEHSGKSIFCSAPAYSLSGRSKEWNYNQGAPGPASYTLPPCAGSQNCGHIFSPHLLTLWPQQDRSFHEDLKKTPGPAAYKVVDPCVYRQKPPQYSMMGRNFTPDETTKTPGPGAHYPEQVTFTKRKAPKLLLPDYVTQTTSHPSLYK